MSGPATRAGRKVVQPRPGPSVRGRQGTAPAVVLTIAGFDPSSGAGVTADLQVFAAHGLFGTSCVTALTVQSTRGVAGVKSVSNLIGATLEELHADLPAQGIKIGMLGDTRGVKAVSAFLNRRSGPKIPVVLDPVVRSSSGRRLLSDLGLTALREELLPLVDWVTPNLQELAVLGGGRHKSGRQQDTLEALSESASRYPTLHWVATGGDSPTEAGLMCTDILTLPGGEAVEFSAPRVDTTSTHGTGCAFSSALLARLVLGDDPIPAVKAAKAYVVEALRRAPGLGGGRGPMDLLWPLRREDGSRRLRKQGYRR